ncbi:hypothetical protein SSX86_023146 [Deinandra increscens subsp. villosa]|uniref:Uncharacterized protein n=1 Tax=Deinandra increscens subsp. villosa TaxID=3103831 RepID=A0AAP0GT60_9ASTR
MVFHRSSPLSPQTDDVFDLAWSSDGVSDLAWSSDSEIGFTLYPLEGSDGGAAGGGGASFGHGMQVLMSVLWSSCAYAYICTLELRFILQAMSLTTHPAAVAPLGQGRGPLWKPTSLNPQARLSVSAHEIRSDLAAYNQ